MITLKSLRPISLLGPVFFCYLLGCDIPGFDYLYELDVVVENKTGEPISGVSYNVLENPYKNNVGRGQTSSDGRVHWSSVGRCDILVELEKPGFKKISKKMVMKPHDSPPVVLQMEEE